MGAKLRSHMSKFISATERNLDAATLDASTDVMKTSQVIAPKLTRALVKSHKITRVKSAHYRITAGSGRVPYARKRHFENKKNPGTLKYLERAGDATAKKLPVFVKKYAGRS